jgi:hypothetical protein
MADVQSVTYSGFAGGINTRLPAADIADNEVVDALNMELDRQNALQSRGGLVKLIDGSGGGLPGRVTSLYHYRKSDGTDTVLFTSGTKLYRMAPAGTIKTDLTSTLTLPNDAYWQWVTFNDQAIGVNRATSGDNPVLVASPTAVGATALGGTAPKSLFVEVWNFRVWYVSAASPNQLYFTALGTTNDCVTPGAAGGGSINVGGNEGGAITGIKSHKGSLFVFKRDKLYVLQPGSPNTDSQQFEVQLISDHVGCVSAYSIQTLLNDLVFMSDYGVQSLQSLVSKGDFESQPLSLNVNDITNVNRNVDTYASVVDSEKLRYILATPPGGGSTNLDAWVLDYSRVVDASGPVAWTRWDGAVVGSAYAMVLESGTPRVYVGNAGGIYRYGDVTGTAAVDFKDAGALYNRQIVTKAYAADQLLWRKEFTRYGMEFGVQALDLSVSVNTRVDENVAREKHLQLDWAGQATGGLWDAGLWDAATWGGAYQNHVEFSNSLRGSFGRRGQTLQFVITNKLAEGFSLKRLSFDFVLLTRRWTGELTAHDARKP